MSTKYINKLNGQRVLVIGGSTGIGFAVAEAALEHGANVVISSSNQSKIDSAIERLKTHINNNHLPIRKISGKVCNLAKPETIEANVKELLESASQDGKLDHVVFTAGDFNPSPSLDSATVSVISKIGMVRVMGALFVAKHLSSYINQTNRSSFTITGTTTDSRPAGAGWSVLKAAAGGIEPMTRALCMDLKPVRVNCVTPGFVHTALFDGFPQDVRDVIFPAMEKDSVAGRLGTAEELAEAYVYLMKCTFATGSIVVVDGGRIVGDDKTDATGKSFASNDFFGVVRKFAGYDTRTLDRQVFLRQLYELLPDKSQVYEKARVEDTIEENSSARVVLADGREFVGDVVVGSDGVHSKVREIMWDKANALRPGMITVGEKRAMVTQYNAIVMASSPVPGIGAHDMEITSNDKYSFLLLCQPDWISIIVHSKLPEDQQYTVVFGELWKRRLKAQMISLEEGVLEHWTSGRIVLAGDAVHKVTPNSALGGNRAMEDAFVTANTLHALLARHPNKKPSDVELQDAMRQEYQDTRVDRARAIVKAGGVLTRQQAYDGWKAYITQRWLTPVIGLDKLAQKIAGLCVTAPKLNYVEFEERRGILGWQDTMEAEKEHSMKGKAAKKEKTGMSWSNWNGGFEAIFPHISGVLVILWLALWLFHLIDSEDHVPGFERDTLSFVEVFNTSWRKPY
ncbi:hypothetical protein BFJ65_g9882 [Fusarium oxysporum f. sp. cepae]|uniref:FAD-binding domain-containing protein n=1 Tax=Fusarium oxysporum f. sp. cepae TaxID=396571 RepID=A0A3L6NGY2_FUSOX|nr:hypothetical protein BFJ65_g9882 [Fusarium oxysporum f. sp. cepae]RKK52092.1 hypothetical protein BFJ67_g5771 [Fusarium oxysporum f. sp. cepae]